MRANHHLTGYFSNKMIKFVLYESECCVIFNQNQAKENTIMIALNKNRRYFTPWPELKTRLI